VATARRPQPVEEIDQQEPQQVRIDPAFDPALSEVTRPSDLGFGKAREIEVEPLQDLPVQVSDDGFMEIRMAETIEEFTYGNPHYMVKLEQGKRYRVPAYVGHYLIGLGKVYQRA
jgi:hypothetical protein